MLSRAHLIIEQQMIEVNNEYDIKVRPLNEKSLFELVAQISGRPNTLWQDGILQIYMKFDENFNQVPPAVWFLTIPFHPNVDQYTGRPNLDIIDDIDKWRMLSDADKSIKYVLRSIQFQLSNPYLDKAVNMDAVFMLKCNPKKYEAVIVQSVKMSHRLRSNFLGQASSLAPTTNRDENERTATATMTSDLSQFESESMSVSRAHRRAKLDQTTESTRTSAINDPKTIRTDTSNSRVKQPQAPSKSGNSLSFADYVVLWRNIGTAKSSKTDENEYVNSQLLTKPHLLPQHLSISLKELESQLNQQQTEHKHLMYGKIHFSNHKSNLIGNTTAANSSFMQLMAPKTKTKPINYNQLMMNDVHKENRIDTTQIPNETKLDEETRPNDSNVFYEDVDELIKWSEKL